MMFYMTIFRVFLLALMVKALLAIERPFVCSGFYAFARFLFFLLLPSVAFLPALILGAIVFGTSSLYFWLLDQFDPGSGIWWAIFVVGILVCFFTGLL